MTEKFRTGEKKMNKLYDVIIIGAGPAGLSAGAYAGRARLSTLIIEKAKEDVYKRQVLESVSVHYRGVLL